MQPVQRGNGLVLDRLDGNRVHLLVPIGFKKPFRVGAVGLTAQPPHWHDVGELLREYRARLASIEDAELERVVTASAWLRKEREFSFYGDIDFIPRERYGRDEAMRAVEDARFVVGIAARVIPDVDPISPSGGAAAPS